MFAVVKTGGKQYKVAAEDIITIEKISGDAGEIVQLSEVLMLGGAGDAQVGAPFIEGASVAAEVLDQNRARKIKVFKKKRRQNYRRTAGHRQHQTILRVTEILTDGKKPSAKPAKKAAPKKAAPKAETKKAEAKKEPAKKAAAKKTPAEKADKK